MYVHLARGIRLICYGMRYTRLCRPDASEHAVPRCGTNSMEQMNFQAPQLPTRAQRFAFIAAVLVLFGAAIFMLTRFLPALAWAVVLAIATWPLFVFVRHRLGRNTAAAAITVLIALVILIPLGIAAIQAVHEARGLIVWVIEARKDGFAAPAWISGLPMVGPAIADWLNAHFKPENNPFESANISSLTEWGGMIGRQAVRRITTLAFALLIVFFVFRNSDFAHAADPRSCRSPVRTEGICARVRGRSCGPGHRRRASPGRSR